MALRRSHFQCGKCEGRRSQSSVARTPSLALPPRWARKEFCVVACTALLTFVCMLRYWMWNVVLIWFLDSSIFMAIRYADLQSGSGILRYLWWYTGPTWFLYSSIFMVIRWADPVSVFFDTYRNILYQSDISGQDAQSASIPPHVFSCRLEASARRRWHRAGLLRRRGDYYLGCGRRRYCGRVCCLSRRRVLALPQCF